MGEHYPKPEERDNNGVCLRCLRMTKTIVIDVMRLPGFKKHQNDLRSAYKNFQEGEFDDPEAYNSDEIGIFPDYREVTACCRSEDYIPAQYAVRCVLCKTWTDRRWSKLRGEVYVCPACTEKAR